MLKESKSLSILHTESSMGWGGQEMRILIEAVEFEKRDHKVIIACQPESELFQRCRNSGIKAISIKMSKHFFFSSCPKLYKVMKQEKIDIVNTHSSTDSWLGSIAAKMAGVKLIRTRHLDVPISNNPLNIIYKLPDKIITTSKAIRSRLIQMRIPETKIMSIPTGVDINNFKPKNGNKEFKKVLGILERDPVITKVAVLRNWKGHHVLFRAIKDVVKVFPQAVFLIVGDGPQRNVLEQLIDELKINHWIKMTGHRNDVHNILNITDLFVLSSTKYEGVPQALLQAMATNIPVVASDMDGVRDVVKNGETGLLVQPSDHRSLARKIIFALRDVEMASTIADNGRRLVEEHHSIDVMLDQLKELYKELVAH